MVDNLEDDTLPHGGVKGIRIPKDKLSVVIGIWDKHFNQKPDPNGKGGPLQFRQIGPEYLNAIQQSIRPPVFIPVDRTIPGKDEFFVIEFDVRPVSSLCGDRVFSLRTLGPGGKLIIRYFLRDGASTKEYSEMHYKALQSLVKTYAKSRQVF